MNKLTRLDISSFLLRGLATRIFFLGAVFFCTSCTAVRPQPNVDTTRAPLSSDHDSSVKPPPVQQSDKTDLTPKFSTTEVMAPAPKPPLNNVLRVVERVADRAPGPLHHFTLSGVPTTDIAGSMWNSPAHDVTVSAYDQDGKLKTDYSGRIYFSSTDKTAVLPFTAGSPYTFTQADKGSHTFTASGFSLTSSGRHTITVTDGMVSITTGLIRVYLDGAEWKKTVDTASFPQRRDHSCATYDNKIWIIGGATNRQKNDVWYSSDGFNWSCATKSAQFSPRSSQVTMVYDDKMWVIGGYDGDYFMGTNDVWFSSNGADWSAATKQAAFSKRFHHQGVVYDGKMWIIGGKFQNDIWWSTNGSEWFLANDNPPFGGRYGFSCLAFGGKMWVIGGYSAGYRNDVWWSTNGTDWHLATAQATFSPRYNHESLLYNNKMWVIGGRDSTPKNDVWFSSNGSAWTAATLNAGFTPRNGHACTVLNNKMWLIGGGLLRDVWFSD